MVANARHRRPGPTPGLRVDMDALDPTNSMTIATAPYRDHFAFLQRRHDAVSPAAHDGHTAIGLGLAHVLKQYAAQLNGASLN